MNIGFAGPVSLDLLNFNWSKYKLKPKGYPFPMTAFLVNGFMEKGHKVTVFTTSDDINSILTLKQDNLRICIARRQPHAGRDLFKSERKDLIQLIKANPADIINAHWTYEFAWAALDSGVRTIVTIQDHAYTILKYQLDPFRFMRLLMNFIVLNKAQHLISNSEYLYELLSENKKKKTKVIHNFYDKSLKFDFGKVNKKSNNIVTISNGFGNRKNIKNGLKAFKIIKQKYPDFEYHLIGDDMGKGGQAYIYAKNKELLDGVKFLGDLPFSDVKEEISKATICLHPSREESFGMSVLESQVMGTIVIGGEKSGNIPYLIEDERTGYLCNVDDPYSMTDALIKCIENPIERKIIENKAREVAEEKYTSKKIISCYLREFENILKSTSKKNDYL